MTLSALLAQSKHRRGLAALLAAARQRRARSIPEPPAGFLPDGVVPVGYEQQLVVQQPPELIRLSPNTSSVVVAEHALGLPRQLGAGAVQFGSGGRFLLMPDAVGTGLLLVDTEESLVEGQRLPPFTKKVRRWSYEGGVRQRSGARHNFAYFQIPDARIKPKKMSDRVEALASVIGSVLERGRLPEGARRKGSRAAVRVTSGGLSALLQQSKRRRGLRAMLDQAKTKREVSAPALAPAPVSAASAFEGVEQKRADALKIGEPYAARALVPESKKIKGKGWTQILPKNPAPRDVAEAALTHGKWEALGSVRDAKRALERALAAGSGVGFLVVQPYPGRPWEIRWTAPIAQIGKQLFVDQSLAATMEAFRAPAKRYLKLLSDLGWNRRVTYVLPSATAPIRRSTGPGHVMVTVDDQGNFYVTDGKMALPMRSAKVQALMARGELPVKHYADLDRALTEVRKANEIGRALSKNTGDPSPMAIDSRSFMQVWPTFAQLVPVPDPRFTLVQTNERHPGLLTFVRPDGSRQGVNPIYLAAAIEAVGAPHTLYVHESSPRDPILIEGPKGRALVMPMWLG